MTTATMIRRVRSLLAYDLDLMPSVDDSGAAQDATDADVVGHLNDAQDRLSMLCPIFDPSIPLTLTAGKNTYDLSTPSTGGRRIMRALDVIVGGRPLRNARGNKPGPWALAELDDRHPSWRTDAPGTPLRWSPLSESLILLSPAPDALSAPGIGTFVSGYAFAKSLSADQPNQVSELPQELHEPMARMAAAISAQAVATNGDQLAKVNAWMQDAQAIADRIGSADRRAKSPIGSTSQRFTRDYLRMR